MSRIKPQFIYVSALLVFVAILYFFFGSNASLSAQTADFILRPLLGSKKTILLESLYFSTIDKVTALSYHLNPATTTTIASDLPTFSPKVYAANIDEMDLTPLSVDTSLPSLTGEGVWEPMLEALFPQNEVLARTIFRPDKDKPYAVVNLVKMDMQKLGIGIQAGTYYPGNERHKYGKGIVPFDIQKADILVAAFNGGFQEKDGAYGMTMGQTVYVPLKNNMPALLLFANGSVQLTMYTGGQLSNAVVAVRQNGPYLINNGVITPYVESGNDTWGRTTTNSMYTWRSGLGITKNGNLIYAVGDALVPQTLAKALLAAGAVNAIQLDINPYWVRFILYQSQGNGKYTFAPLLKDMQNGGYSYLHGYNKDFFYLYKK